MPHHRYSIFISSTFKDMDAERDVLKYNVIPLLNNRYRRVGIEFYPIDLRFGINTEDMTEEESENAVLDVCLSKIESSRPFFIALIGDRYGWIPQEERIRQVLSKLSEDKRHLVVDGIGCSVTELEILYGAIGGDGENINHSLFFIRDPESYKGIPDKTMPIYADGFGDRLELLKEHILTILKSKDRQNAYIPYSLNWDCSNSCFSSLDKFGEVAYLQLCNEIEAEISSLSQTLKWYEYAWKMTTFQIDRNCADATDLYDVNSLVDTVYKDKHILVSGKSGTGKSTLLSQVYNVLHGSDKAFPLAAIIGTTPYITSLNNILFLWIYQLEQNLSLPCSSDAILEDQQAYHLLYNRFYELVDIYMNKGINIICLLDGFEALSERDSAACNLQWLRQDLYLICSCRTQTSSYGLAKQSVRNEFALDGRKFNVSQLVLYNEGKYEVFLPEKLERMMENNGVSPMHVKLFMIMVSHLTAKDFKNIRTSTEETEIEKINNYIINLYLSLPKSLDEVFDYSVSFIVERLAADWLKDIIAYIASSRTGLRKEDMALFAGKDWDELKFTLFMNIFSEFFTEDEITKLWSIKSMAIAQTFFSKSSVDELCKRVSCYPDDDTLKNNYFAYYTILAEDADVAEKFLCDDEVYQPIGSRRYWSEEAIICIENDRESIRSFAAMINNLQPKSKLRLLYAFLTSLPAIAQNNSYLYFAEQIAEIEVSLETSDDLYALATLMNNAALHVKYFSNSTELYNRLVEGAYLSYRLCYETDSSFADVKNMYRVSMMNKADILCSKGDFDGAMTLFQLINNI